MKSLFIALEGIDGSGKSTQIKLLEKKLGQFNIKSYPTFEPTDKPIGKMIRDIFSGKMEGDHRTIAALFAADRLEHILNHQDGILKMLQQNYTVISDRYYLSSYAYHGTHMDMDWVIHTNKFCAELCKPNIHIYIDIEPEVSMQRIQKGRTNIELYETLENLTKVRDKYFEAFERVGKHENIVIIDGNRPENLIAKDIWNAIEQLTS